MILYSSSGLPAALNDPSIAKLDRASRYYIDYCEFEFTDHVV